MKSRFYDYANLLINNIEGGYYSPVRHYSSAMGRSGETMFGMDRTWGGSEVTESTPGKAFWKLIDANSSAWSYNSKGGKVEKELRKLAAEIMGARYERLFKKCLSSKAQKLVSKSPRLEIHFYYACWNGDGRFEDFADTINSAIKAGTTNLKELEKIALDSRLNYSVPLIRTGGQKMRDKVWPQLPEGGKSTWIWWLAGTVVLTGTGIVCYQQGYFNKLIKKLKR